MFPVHRWFGVTEDGIGLTMATVAMPVRLVPTRDCLASPGYSSSNVFPTQFMVEKGGVVQEVGAVHMEHVMSPYFFCL